MSEMTAIAQALSAFGALKNIAQAMISLRDAEALQLKVIEFNGALIDAQTKIFSVNEERTALIERIRNLEKQNADLETWEAEKQRYELKSIGSNSFIYAVKPAMQGTEPAHQICANCYQDRKKSILQEDPANTMGWGNRRLLCPVCETRIVT